MVCFCYPGYFHDGKKMSEFSMDLRGMIVLVLRSILRMPKIEVPGKFHTCYLSNYNAFGEGWYVQQSS